MDSAVKMAIGELVYLSGKPVEEKTIGGLPYIIFDGKPEDIGRLSRLSFAFALFELHGELLKPIEKDCGYFIDEDISSILKYSGKTSEIFTRLMLNLALSHQDTPVKLLDPMAGKGTTLYEGLMRHCDVYGIEIDLKPAGESFMYMKKHLEIAKYKHNSHQEKLSGVGTDGKKFTALRYSIEMANNKENMKTGKTHMFEMIAGDTRNARLFFKKNFFHTIVADLPYGVQHTAKNKTPNQSGSRNAIALLQEAMPIWMQVLKPGGVIVLAWNLFLIKREEMEQLFIQNGLDVKITDFSHRLDQATHRDLIIATRI